MFDLSTYLTDLSTTPNVDTKIANYLAKYPFLFPQINVWGGVNETTRRNLEKQNRLDVRWLDKHTITRRIEPWKSVTTWFIATVMFDGVIPIGIIRATDNREDRFDKFLPINYEQHHHAGLYLFNFVEADPGPELELYDTHGAFSGDVQPHYRSVQMNYYDLTVPGDVLKIEDILLYTEEYPY